MWGRGGLAIPSFSVAGIKESVCWTPPVDMNTMKTCEYHALCARFKDLLLLPGEPGPASPWASGWGALLLVNPPRIEPCVRPNGAGWFQTHARGSWMVNVVIRVQS